MLYRNDNLKITDTYIIGSIKDLKEYFRYEIANQCMSFNMSISNLDYENFRDNVKNIIDVLDNLYEDTINGIFTDNDIIKVSEHPMGGFVIESECEN